MRTRALCSGVLVPIDVIGSRVEHEGTISQIIGTECTVMGDMLNWKVVGRNAHQIHAPQIRKTIPAGKSWHGSFPGGVDAVKKRKSYTYSNIRRTTGQDRIFSFGERHYIDLRNKKLWNATDSVEKIGPAGKCKLIEVEDEYPIALGIDISPTCTHAHRSPHRSWLSRGGFKKSISLHGSKGSAGFHTFRIQTSYIEHGKYFLYHDGT